MNQLDSQEKTEIPPWPYQTIEKWLQAKVADEKPRNPGPFYPDFMEDVFAGVL